MAAANSSFERSLAVTVRVSVEVTSALPTTVVLKLGDHAQATGDGQTEPAHGVRLWAKNYSDGPECGSSISDVAEAANIRWTDAAPNSTHRWTGWLILAGSITPSDPTGSKSSLGGLLISPHVTLAGSSTTIRYLTSESPHLVSCSADDAAAGTATTWPSGRTTPSGSAADGRAELILSEPAHREDPARAAARAGSCHTILSTPLLSSSRTIRDWYLGCSIGTGRRTDVGLLGANLQSPYPSVRPGRGRSRWPR